MKNYILKSKTNAKLQKVLLLATQCNIIIKFYWPLSKNNKLVDILSGFIKSIVAKLCLYL